jgi:hypothetical protein
VFFTVGRVVAFVGHGAWISFKCLRERRKEPEW